MLQMDSKIHFICGMNDHIDEVHAHALELCTGIRVHKGLHQLLKSVLLSILNLEIVHCFYYFDMTTLD